MAEIPLYPLYSSTFTTYRLSPLYHGESPLLEPSTLRTHSRRLRDLLKGDNLRGVQVDFAGSETATHNSGPLEECHWDLLGDDDSWIESHRQVNDPESSHASNTLSPETARGIAVHLQYARHAYSAFLLRDPETTSSIPDFTSFPLLLVRMPAQIREIFLNYLATTFDTRISPLKLRPSFLTSVLETHLQFLTADSSNQPIPDVIKQVHFQLSFPTTTTLLKSIDIAIASGDVSGFLTSGKQLSRVSNDSTPFTTALAAYLKSHLALDLSNEKTHISKIACGAFALGSEGRIKLYPPPPLLPDSSFTASSPSDASAAELAMHDLYKSLIREASGSSLFLINDATEGVEQTRTKQAQKRGLKDTAPAEVASKRSKGRGRSRGRTVESEQQSDTSTDRQTPGGLSVGGIPTEPPPPYAEHDPSLVST